MNSDNVLQPLSLFSLQRTKLTQLLLNVLHSRSHQLLDPFHPLSLERLQIKFTLIQPRRLPLFGHFSLDSALELIYEFPQAGIG